MTHELTLDPAESAPRLAQPVSGIEIPSRPDLRIAPGSTEVDLEAAQRAAANFLAPLGSSSKTTPWPNSTPAGRGSASSSRPPCRHSRHSIRS